MNLLLSGKKCMNATGFYGGRNHLNMNSKFHFYTQFSISFSKIPRVSFSPESGGRVNPRRAIEEMSTQGTIRLKK